MTEPRTESSLLEELKVLVTRPAQQADSLCQCLAGYGARVERFPLLEIHDVKDKAWLDHCVEHLQVYDWAIFISVNSVQRAVPGILERRSWPEKTRIAVIGKSSEAALQRVGLAADACPETQFDSEGLLDLPEMQRVSGLRVVIFRGNGGRETLADRLGSRGADVKYLECYRRIKPEVGSLKADEFGKIISADLILINSAQSLHNLLDLFQGQQAEKLLNQQLLVVSQRLLEIVRRAGFVKLPLLADNATDQAVLETILNWQRQRVNKQKT